MSTQTPIITKGSKCACGNPNCQGGHNFGPLINMPSTPDDPRLVEANKMTVIANTIMANPNASQQEKAAAFNMLMDAMALSQEVLVSRRGGSLI